jgi:hypothetical protein
MTDFPAEGAFDIGSQTKSDMADLFEQVLAATKQLPGAHYVTQLQIASGVLTPVLAAHNVYAENGDPTDDLNTLATTYVRNGHILFLSNWRSGQTITIKHLSGGIGQLCLATQEDWDLEYGGMIAFRCDGTWWMEIIRSQDHDADDVQDGRLDELDWWICQAFGGGSDGVIGIGATPSSSLSVYATTPSSMAVTVAAGQGMYRSAPFRRASGGNYSSMIAPVSNPRIDTVAVCTTDDVYAVGTVVVHTGVEAASPVAPTVDTNELLLAWVHHRVGETTIENADDTTNGYIEDARTPLNF